MQIDYTFSGHETFPLRISWLPKSVAAIEKKLDVFKDVRNGMAVLGLGKNMIQSLDFWTQACGLATKNEEGYILNSFAISVLSRKGGKDPFLETPHTLWLLHWHLCQGWVTEEGRRKLPYAWYYFSSGLTNDEISASEAVEEFKKVPTRSGKELSEVTLRQHFEIFARTYLLSPSLGRITPEDGLDSPLTSLGLLRKAGDRRTSNGKREPVFLVDKAPKPSLSDEVIRFALHSWWNIHHHRESSATIREVALNAQSPGMVFQLPETTVFEAVKRLASKYPKELQIRESQNQRILTRERTPRSETLLTSIFAK